MFTVPTVCGPNFFSYILLMIRFTNKLNDKDEILSYDELVKEFLNSHLSTRRRGFIIEMILFLDYTAKKRGLTFVRLQRADWAQLILASSRLQRSYDKGLLY